MLFIPNDRLVPIIIFQSILSRQLVAKKNILLRCEAKKNILTLKKTIAFKLNGCSLNNFYKVSQFITEYSFCFPPLYSVLKFAE